VKKKKFKNRSVHCHEIRYLRVLLIYVVAIELCYNVTATTDTTHGELHAFLGAMR